ncbi:3334_t:CDS:1, partial [Acaulospora colombiana]
SIIERAADQHFKHLAVETGLQLHSQSIKYADALKSIIMPQGSWSSLDFDDLIGECEKYSLVRISTQDEEKFYSMHILVQNFLQASCRIVLGHPSSRLVTRLLGSAVTIGAPWEYLAFNRSVSSHLQLINLDDVVEAGDHYGFGVVLNEVGDGKLAVKHMEHCVEIWRGSVSEESENLLDAMEILARSYSTAGKEEEALGLRENVMKKTREILGDDHLNTILAIGNLASSYWSLGRSMEAVPLEEEVLEKCRKLLGDDHLDTISAIANLASSYSSLGRSMEAVPLREEVLEKRRKLLGDDHLDTINAIHNLAVSYSKVGGANKALPLAEEAVKKWTNLLGEDHQKTHYAMGNLANVYAALGQANNASKLQAQISSKQSK